METTEKFAVYGFELAVPADWRVEINPKATRKKGDVVFHSEMGNRLFVSWGALEEAKKRFETLEEHRDSAFNQIKKGADVKSFAASNLKETRVAEHRALESKVSTAVRASMFGGGTTNTEVWSVHFYCDALSRYYVVYIMERNPTEFEDTGQLFHSIVGTFICHPSSGVH